MKKVILSILLTLPVIYLSAQMGINTDTPDASAALEVYSTDQGILIPRVILSADLTSQSPVSNPAIGLMVYNSGSNQPAGFYSWTGSLWDHQSSENSPTLIQVYNNTPADMNTDTPVAIPWDGEDFKDAGLYTHSTTTDNTRIEVESDGIYEISYVVNTNNGSNTRNTVRTRIRLNGTTFLNRGTTHSYSRNTANDYQTNALPSVMLQLNANDYIEVLGDRTGDTGAGPTIVQETYINMKLIRKL
jgi:hypothetical protein